MAIASWSLVRVYGTWADAKGNMLSGTYKISVPARLTNSTDDLIIPAGTYDSGALNTTPGLPSLSVLCPSTDDPDIQQDNWKLTVEITLNGGRAPEKYTLDVPIANRPVMDGGNGIGVNLRTIMLAANTPPQVALYGVGVAGGLAVLSSDGLAVLDAEGNPITSGGGGATTVDELTDASTVGKAVVKAADAAAARAAIGAGTGSSNLTIGTTSTTAAAGDHGHAYSTLSDRPALGDAAAKNTGTAAGTVAAGDDSRITGAAQKSANLSDLADVATARTNLALGAAATMSVGTTHGSVKAGEWTPGIADLPAGSVIRSTNAAARPTARTDVTVIFLTDADPSAVMLDNDIWRITE